MHDFDYDVVVDGCEVIASFKYGEQAEEYAARLVANGSIAEVVRAPHEESPLLKE